MEKRSNTGVKAVFCISKSLLSTLSSATFGGLEVQCSKASLMDVLRIRSPSAMAASTDMGSFKVVRACIGVVEVVRRTQDASPEVPSKTASIG